MKIHRFQYSSNWKFLYITVLHSLLIYTGLVKQITVKKSSTY